MEYGYGWVQGPHNEARTGKHQHDTLNLSEARPVQTQEVTLNSRLKATAQETAPSPTENLVTRWSILVWSPVSLYYLFSVDVIKCRDQKQLKEETARVAYSSTELATTITEGLASSRNYTQETAGRQGHRSDMRS